MLRLLRALFEPRDTLPYPLHFHPDDQGRDVLCDETACRPDNDPLVHGR